MPRRVMTEAEILEFMTMKAREIKKSPYPTKRRQPKVTRMQSPRQRAAERMTKNPMNAIFQDVFAAENSWRYIPTLKGEGTREVGPGDEYNNDYRTGKDTRSR